MTQLVTLQKHVMFCQQQELSQFMNSLEKKLSSLWSLRVQEKTPYD